MFIEYIHQINNNAIYDILYAFESYNIYIYILSILCNFKKKNQNYSKRNLHYYIHNTHNCNNHNIATTTTITTI